MIHTSIVEIGQLEFHKTVGEDVKVDVSGCTLGFQWGGHKDLKAG